MGKEVISIILNQEKRNWMDANIAKPDPGVHVVFRFVNENKVYAEDDEHIVYAEDMKVGTFLRDIDDPTNGRWVIDPPYPKYDYSPLSNKDQILDGSVVTHWSLLDEGEMEGWQTRYEPIGKYGYLNIQVAPQDEENVYNALLWGANLIARAAGNEFSGDDPKWRDKYAVLNDLQACIDSGHHMSNGEMVKNANVYDSECIDEAHELYFELIHKYPDEDKLRNILACMVLIHDEFYDNSETEDKGENEDAVD